MTFEKLQRYTYGVYLASDFSWRFLIFIIISSLLGGQGYFETAGITIIFFYWLSGFVWCLYPASELVAYIRKQRIQAILSTPDTKEKKR